ncbi:unnamed protein product [Cuscuta europaea]|uniref:Uncharacterized protein n=1 Tax=Cuscuta europaea TaxID=41803 RepID=A0A9P0Z2A4_CUSEU|nr:unnamed protein product [Cuscuta europaea]
MADSLLISDITPQLASWTCKVSIVEKLNIRESSKSPGKLYKPFVLQDIVGNKVKAMAYGQDISVVDQRLELYKTYNISNALVTAVYPNFNVPDEHYKFLWSINRRTLIQDVDEEDKIEVQENADIVTTPFSLFYNSMTKRETINVLGAIIYKLPREFVVTEKKKKQAKDFIFVDEQSQPIIFTMWDECASIQGVEIQKLLDVGIYPIVLAKRVAVTTYQGLSLSTRYDTCIELYPDTQHAIALKQWRSTNAQAIQNMNTEQAYMYSLVRFALPEMQSKSHVIDVKNSVDEARVFWILSTLRFLENGFIPFYIGCNSCNKGINYTVEGVHFQCLNCGNINGVSTKRFRLSVEVSDATGELQTNLFTNEVYKLLRMLEININPDCINSADLNDKVKALTFIVALKIVRPNIHSKAKKNFSVLSLSFPTDIRTCSDAQSTVVHDNVLPNSPEGKRKLIGGENYDSQYKEANLSNLPTIATTSAKNKGKKHQKC